jgi:hypothetical protein
LESVTLEEEFRVAAPRAAAAAAGASQPGADVPEWLLNLVRDETHRRGGDAAGPDLKKLAMEVGLPLRKLQQAADSL